MYNDLSIQCVIQLTQPHPTYPRSIVQKDVQALLFRFQTDDKPLLMINHFGRRVGVYLKKQFVLCLPPTGFVYVFGELSLC